MSLATKSGGAWTLTPILTAPGLRTEALDVAASDGVARVAFSDFEDTNMYAARVEGGTVELEVIDPDYAYYDEPVSIAVDAAGVAPCRLPLQCS